MKVKCPSCGKYMKAQRWKEGMFDECIHCHKRFKWKHTGKLGFSFLDPPGIEYSIFCHLLAEDFHLVRILVWEKYAIGIRRRWIDNSLLEFYAHKQGEPEMKYDLVEIFRKINRDEEIRRKLYQRWMDLVH